MSLRPEYYYTQSAVIPYRRVARVWEVLLITSRKGKRWVIPKGIVEPNMHPAQSAAKEAWEEAGVRGTVAHDVIGTYRYDKWGGTCTVTVYPLLVTEVLIGWPEDFRTRRWQTPDEAAGRVCETALAEMLRSLPDLLTAISAPGAPQQS